MSERIEQMIRNGEGLDTLTITEYELFFETIEGGKRNE